MYHAIFGQFRSKRPARLFACTYCVVNQGKKEAQTLLLYKRKHVSRGTIFCGEWEASEGVACSTLFTSAPTQFPTFSPRKKGRGGKGQKERYPISFLCECVGLGCEGDTTIGKRCRLSLLTKRKEHLRVLFAADRTNIHLGLRDHISLFSRDVYSPERLFFCSLGFCAGV